jgi:ribosomal protein S18 acetylase RimI-like enzyme
MPDDLARAYEFLTRADMAWERSEPTRFGTAVFDDRVPKRYDSNYLLVDTLPAGTTAEDLAADARAYGRPLVFVRNEQVAEPLERDFQRLGWRVDRHVFMVQRRPPERSAPVELVRELDPDALRPARRSLIEHFAWATPEVLDELHRAKRLIAERVDTRFLGIVVDGEVVAYADVYIEAPNAQIEDVGTLEEHRGRGYASAVVLYGVEAARRAGADFVFLVADAHDWPQHLYRRLGFDPIGRYVKFIGPGV